MHLLLLQVAVQDLSLVVRRGECFGLLGPNGAGKTTAINMLTGFIEPTAGTGIVEGLDIRSDMPQIYKLMGVCPQHDLLWEQLSGREHLRFYGRLKGLEGEATLTVQHRDYSAACVLVASSCNCSVARWDALQHVICDNSLWPGYFASQCYCEALFRLSQPQSVNFCAFPATFMCRPSTGECSG
jgi:energy-coupling factor transporter ATP-binding protein EcfA2